MLKLTADLKMDLDGLAADAKRKLSQVVRKATADIEAHAKVGAPVDTGFLRNSIQGSSTGPLSGEVAVGAEYGPHVEFGTVHQAPQPYLGPAVEAVRPGFERAARKAVEDAARGNRP